MTSTYFPIPVYVHLGGNANEMETFPRHQIFLSQLLTNIIKPDRGNTKTEGFYQVSTRELNKGGEQCYR